MGLELGGKNPIIVMDDADLDLAIKDSISAAFEATGLYRSKSSNRS